MRRLIEELEAKASAVRRRGRVKARERVAGHLAKGLGDVHSHDGDVRDRRERQAVVGFVKDVTFADRVKRIELLGRHINVQAFKEKLSLTVQDPLKTLFEQISGNVIRPAASPRCRRR